ncbi:Zinc finger CCHC domain-containing protein 7 [Cuculus canorus]|uniref:Zinc finger CCHC domain-containing protein 7 n=2 Tax=Cuculus canorus TaxID=55661 RepID=A0A091G8R0_CUCCA|nr:Zinc finger CCHC domain-containing protein 7 [Cuculus canorus]
MFDGYEGAEDAEVYEDELYREESSSEQSIDSEVEFHLYSQIHYSQNLEEISTLEINEEADVVGGTDHSAQLSDDPEVIVLSDTADEDSVYKIKATKSTSSLGSGKIQAPPGTSTPRHDEAPGYNTMYPTGSSEDVSKRSKSTSGKHTPVTSAGLHATQDILVIDDSSEEESFVSESDNVESWMLLGADAVDGDDDIMLNLEGCATPVGEG